MRLLRELGYTNVRHYHGGLADWKDSGGPIESVAPTIARAAPQAGPRPRAILSRTTELRAGQWGNAILDLIERRSTLELFLAWLAVIVLSGVVYWISALAGLPALTEHSAPVASTLKGLATAVYFSFVTATSIGYGDVLPMGLARILAVAEAVASLMIFGAVIAKFVSRRQEQLVSEIHRVTFEERLDRVQTNLHLVLSELHTIAGMCESRALAPKRVSSRLESAALIFSSELRTVSDLLYHPEREPEEFTLKAILVSLAAALDGLKDLLSCLSEDFSRSPVLSGTLKTISALAEEICAECVPRAYAPALTVWMDRVQAIARDLS